MEMKITLSYTQYGDLRIHFLLKDMCLWDQLDPNNNFISLCTHKLSSSASKM